MRRASRAQADIIYCIYRSTGFSRLAPIQAKFFAAQALLFEK
jgi:hypothetical protein